MCGRTAQTHAALRSASQFLERDVTKRKRATETSEASENGQENFENYNMSPGMDAFIFWKDIDGSIRLEKKIWGLVTKSGTKNNPLPEGMSKHFSGLMFNARSDTLYEKPTFARLLGQSKSCLVAFDGFFEWKNDPVAGKQPYFVQSKSEGFLLMPGLWTSVKTGNDDETLETFTIITTAVCKPLEWLHSRMPICITNAELAHKWLDKPTEPALRQMESASSNMNDGVLQWHPVTKNMSSVKFRGPESIKRVSTTKSVKSFFTVKPKGDAPDAKKETPKRHHSFTSPSLKASSTPRKVQKTGPLDNFFSKQKSP